MPTDLPQPKEHGPAYKAALRITAALVDFGLWAFLTAVFAAGFMASFGVMSEYIPDVPAFGFMACWSMTWVVTLLIVLVLLTIQKGAEGDGQSR